MGAEGTEVHFKWLSDVAGWWDTSPGGGFDDLGLESEMQHYGNSCQVMSEILYSRYDYFHSFGMQTHLTTNLNSTEIEKVYGLRLRSRMREIFNLLAFPADAADKRK